MSDQLCEKTPEGFMEFTKYQTAKIARSYRACLAEVSCSKFLFCSYCDAWLLL